MPEKNELIKIKDNIYRIIAIDGEEALVINCNEHRMPEYIHLTDFEKLPEETVRKNIQTMDELVPSQRAEAFHRYSITAPVLAVIENVERRNEMIGVMAEKSGLSKQTIRSYLRTFLIYQNISALTSKGRFARVELTEDEKNMRWGLNKFFYTQNKNSLPTSYRMLLKEKYCDDTGRLKAVYPTYNQYRYFYRKTKKLENFYISRNGLKDYQRNNRPLLGEGVQEFAPNIGTAMLDGTTCDIFLVNEEGELIGRPILVVAVDANTSLCLGYALLWEGGIYSLQQLMLNILEDKEKLCYRMGIKLSQEQWNIKNELPGVMVTDQGCEYVGTTFEQLTELGITMVNLPSYRPELKGVVEKFFDIIQKNFKEQLS